MAIVVKPSDLDKVLKYAADENLEATLVARVTDTGRMRLSWNGEFIVDITREFLDSNGATQHAKAKVKQFDTDGMLAVSYTHLRKSSLTAPSRSRSCITTAREGS